MYYNCWLILMAKCVPLQNSDRWRLSFWSLGNCNKVYTEFLKNGYSGVMILWLNSNYAIWILIVTYPAHGLRMWMTNEIDGMILSNEIKAVQGALLQWSFPSCACVSNHCIQQWSCFQLKYRPLTSRLLEQSYLKVSASMPWRITLAWNQHK